MLQGEKQLSVIPTKPHGSSTVLRKHEMDAGERIPVSTTTLYLQIICRCIGVWGSKENSKRNLRETGCLLWENNIF